MLSIVIINYFGKQVLYNCIQSVFAHTKDISYELIVIDNSKDGFTRQLITQEFPTVQWLDMGYNAGFGRANNHAFKISRGDAVLLLNPDCIAEDNVIADCYERLVKSKFVAAGVSLLNEDGTFQISGNKAFIGGINYFLPLPYFGKVLKGIADVIMVEKPHFQNSEKTFEVDWISGAFLMVKREAINATKGFDEDFFLYAEEAEWCSRLKKLGPLAIFGDLKITHLLGALATTAFEGKSNSYQVLYDKKGFQIMLSNMVRIRKEFGLGWYLLQMLVFSLVALLALPIGLLHSLFSMKNQMGNLWHFFANAMKLWPYAIKIITKKPYFYKVL